LEAKSRFRDPQRQRTRKYICRPATSGNYSNFAAGDFTCFPKIFFRGLCPNKALQRRKRPQFRVGIE